MNQPEETSRDEESTQQPVVFINGAEVIGEDPIRRAIEQASRNFLEDIENGNTRAA